MNALDFLLLFILFIGVMVGVMRGVLPQLFSLISIWLGLVATLWLYQLFSFNILQGLGIPAIGSDTMSFLILLIVFVTIVNLLVKSLSTPPEERKRKKKSKDDPLAFVGASATQRFVIGPLNFIGGAVMGLLLTTLWAALVLGAMQFIFQPTEVPVGVGFTANMTNQLRGSLTVPWFNKVLYVLNQSVTWFVPPSADFLRKVLGFIG
jgi:uncharacterized membrane protein required for colicin V production